MYRDCLDANRSISFEQYIIRDDHIGMRFLNMFLQKARQGVAVRLIFDRIGSRTVFTSPLIQAIRNSGGRVTFYNPIGWHNLFLPSTWFPRDHVKSLLIDGYVSYVGGVCLADYMKDWQDMYVRMTNMSLRDALSPGDEFDIRFSMPHRARYPIYEELLTRINRATDNVFLATPYFLPPDTLRIALLHAVRRNVDVRIMITEKSDIPLAVHVSRSYFPSLIESGLRIFSYRREVFHAKYAVIDGNWAMLGSANIDYLSLLRNRETELFISDPETVDILKQNFLFDLRYCEELRPDFLRFVPASAKFTGYLGRSLKRVI